MNLPTADHIHGIERNPESPQYGRLVLGGKGQLPITLWKQPGLPIKEENFSGALAHGTEVKVVRHKEHEGELWYYVKCQIRHNGRVYPQKGWLRPDAVAAFHYVLAQYSAGNLREVFDGRIDDDTLAMCEKRCMGAGDVQGVFIVNVLASFSDEHKRVLLDYK